MIGYQPPPMYRFLLMRQPGRGFVCGRGMSGPEQPAKGWRSPVSGQVIARAINHMSLRSLI